MINWTVKKKLSFLIISVTLFFMLLISFLLYQQSISDYKIKGLYDGPYQQSSDLGDIDSLLKRSDINVLRMIAIGDPVSIKIWQKQNDDNFSKIDQLISKFMRNGHGDLLNSVNRLNQSYLLMRKGMSAQISSIQLGNVKDSVDINRTQVKPFADQVFTELNTLNKLVNDSAKTNVDSQLSSSQLSLFISLAITLLVMIYAVTAGLYLTRGILRQLGAEPAVAVDAVNAIASGSLNHPIILRMNDSTSLLAQLKKMQSALSSLVKDVRYNAENVAEASAEISLGNVDLSQRTEEQASALQQTSATMEELTSTVKSNAENAVQANQLAHRTTELAETGGKLVEDVILCMQGISGSSRKIEEIISVINSIAFQTNILALNAAVEAARAGEQGRGFAVVATEVRSLAQRSADAAKEIHNLITASVAQVTEGSVLVDKAGDMMTHIVNAIKQVSDIVNEISAASIEQSNGIAEVGKAIHQMDQTTHQNASLVEESTSASESLKEQANSLVKTVAVFSLE